MVNKVYLEDSRTLNLDLRADPLGEYLMVYCKTVLYFLTQLKSAELKVLSIVAV